MTALHLLGQPDALPREGILKFVFSCLHESGGFGAAPGHDAHMLYTCSAVQIIATLDAFDELEAHMQDGRLKIGQCMFQVLSVPVRQLTTCRDRFSPGLADRHLCGR